MTDVQTQAAEYPLANNHTLIPERGYWKHPDIPYVPDREKWENLTSKRLAENPSLPNATLPDGFPQKFESPLVWEGKDWKNEAQWVYNLTPEHLNEIRDAVRHFNGLGLHFGHISTATFPLPTLGPILRGLANEVYNGRGFVVLRTIPVDSYSNADNVLLYAGISSYFGSQRGLQDGKRGVLSHIMDFATTPLKNQIGSPAYTTTKQEFHTDHGADIISLYALQTATSGGVSRISSSGRVYNEIAATRPDLIRVLSQPWIIDGFGIVPPSERPLLYYLDSRIVIQYARRYHIGYGKLPRSSNLPPVSEAELEALDALHFAAEKHCLGLNFQKGDIQYINNLGLLHGRDGFTDTPEKTRHLLRLWVRDEEMAWKLPKSLEPLWKRTYDIVPENEIFSVDPVIRELGKARN